MEEKNVGEEGRGEKEESGKPGRPSKAELLGRERSWSVGSGRGIDEFRKRKREEVEEEEEEGDSCKKVIGR